MTMPFGLLSNEDYMARRLAGQGAVPKLLAHMTDGQNLPDPPQEGRSTSPMGDPTHAHRSGVRGGIMHLLGADRVNPEVAALLPAEDVARLRPKGLLGAVGQLIEGRDYTQERKAQDIIRLRKQAADQRTWEQIQRVTANIPDEQMRLEAVARLANAYGLPQGAPLGQAAERMRPEPAKVVGPGAELVNDAGQVIHKAPDAPRNPIMGTPEWKAAVSYQASLIPRDDKTLVTVDINGQPVMIPRSQAAGMRPWIAPNATAQRGSATMRRALSSNNTSVGQIDDLIATLSKPGPSNADAVGWKGYIPDAVLNRMFPEGVGTRSGLQNVGSLILHDRFGSALTKTELQRAGFIPYDTDNARTALDKLQKLKEYIAMESGFLQEQVGELAAPNPGNAPAPNAPPASGGRTYTDPVTGKVYRIP